MRQSRLESSPWSRCMGCQVSVTSHARTSSATCEARISERLPGEGFFSLRVGAGLHWL